MMPSDVRFRGKADIDHPLLIDLDFMNTRPKLAGPARAQRASITISPSPSTVNTARSPLAMETVGIKLPVMTTMAGFQITAAFGEMIGEPGKRRARILGRARAGGFAADREVTGNTDGEPQPAWP